MALIVLFDVFVCVVSSRKRGTVDTFVRVVECKRLCASHAMLRYVAVQFCVLQCVAVLCSVTVAVYYSVCCQYDIGWQQLVCSLN